MAKRRVRDKVKEDPFKRLREVYEKIMLRGWDKSKRKRLEKKDKLWEKEGNNVKKRQQNNSLDTLCLMMHRFYVLYVQVVGVVVLEEKSGV